MGLRSWVFWNGSKIKRITEIEAYSQEPWHKKNDSELKSDWKLCLFIVFLLPFLLVFEFDLELGSSRQEAAKWLLGLWKGQYLSLAVFGCNLQLLPSSSVQWSQFFALWLPLTSSVLSLGVKYKIRNCLEIVWEYVGLLKFVSSPHLGFPLIWSFPPHLGPIYSMCPLYHLFLLI